MPPLLQAKLLGDFFLSCDDKPIIGIITERSRALLAYLLLYQHTPQPRHRLAFHLWPESTDSQARTNLRKELSNLRRSLPNADQWLRIDAKTLQWHPSVTVTLDVAQFEEAIKAADPGLVQLSANNATQELEQALGLYQGNLLPECDDEWIVPERERLQQMHVSALEQLIDLFQKQQNYRSGLKYAQQLLRIDPFNEATYCTLMRLHRSSGDRANALQTYHRCMRILRDELGIDPSLTTRKLYEQILQEDAGLEDAAPAQSSQLRPSSPSPILRSVSPLVGREEDWAWMQHWVSGISHNTSSEVLLLLGEPGIGKTRLLEELREMLQAGQVQTGQVLWGRAFAAEMVRPYGIWIDALRSLGLPTSVTRSTELGFLLPELGQPVTAPPNRSHLFDAVVQLLAEWANQAPLVVILDDIQWIDEASSALLHYAIRLLSHLPVGFACTARAAELKENAGSQVIQGLRRERRLKTIELSPLNRGQTAALVHNFKAADPAHLSVEVVDQVFSDSGGNPLFALEVARALSQDQATHGDLEALIGDRLEQLDDGTREVLPWAAALGRSFKPTMVAKVADYPLPQLLMAIDQLERQAVIRPSTSIGNEMGYDFAHDIVRQAVYRQLSEPRRHLVHLQIAHKLNQLSIPDNALAGDIAHHASQGGDHELAASTALLAAERCLKLFAYAEASALAEQGVQHCQHLDQRTRISLQLKLSWVWVIAGVRGKRAAQLEADLNQLIGEAGRFGLKDEEAIGLEAVGVLCFNQSNFTDVHQHSLRMVEISRAVSPATAARLLAHSGSCLAEIGREMVRAEALLLEAQSLAARVDLTLCNINGGLGLVHLHNGRYTEARSLLQQAWQLSQVEQDHWREFIYLSYLAILELEAGDLTAALPYCQEMALVVTKIQGEGSEGAVAAALKALVNYRLQQPGSDSVLEQTTVKLQRVDAKRMLSYVLIGAAEVDLESERLELASIRAEIALQAAQIMQHPSEIALAWATMIRGILALGDSPRATKEFRDLQHQFGGRSLSTRARTAIHHLAQQLDPIT